MKKQTKHSQINKNNKTKPENLIKKEKIKEMQKEYNKKRIDASPYGAPYVIVSLTSSKDLQEGNKKQS